MEGSVVGGEEMDAPPASALSIHPRIWQRRTTVIRQEGRRRLRVLLGLAAVVVVVAAGVGLLYSPWMQARRVTVVGSHHQSARQVIGAAGLSGRPPMIDVHPPQVAQKLAALPWVDSAAVVRSWPQTVHIRLTERTPVAQVAVVSATPAGRVGSTEVALVDRTGRVLETDTAPAAGLPVIAGLGALGPPGSWLPGITASAPSSSGAPASVAPNGGPAAAAVTLASALGPALSAEVATISVGADGTLQALIPSSKLTVLFGSADDIGAKVVALTTVLAATKPGTVTEIDVRVPVRPALTATGAPATVSTAAKG